HMQKLTTATAAVNSTARRHPVGRFLQHPQELTPGVIFLDQLDPGQHLLAIQTIGDKNGKAPIASDPFTLIGITVNLHRYFVPYSDWYLIDLSHDDPSNCFP